ncbi:MAG: hypothetical protein GX962_13415 [Epulopiscium sp.]|nr:hypothetical protein [Candidatus Epulonipiscium sp.]
MKRLIVLILILSGLIGCTAVKKSGTYTDNSRHASTSKEDIVSKQKNDSTVTDKTKTTVTDKSTTETDINSSKGNFSNSIIYFFDTSKPANLTTGLPPVSSIFDTRSGFFQNMQISEYQKKALKSEIENNIRKEYENKLDIQTREYQNNIDKLNMKLKEKQAPTNEWRLVLLGSFFTLVIILLFKLKKLLF